MTAEALQLLKNSEGCRLVGYVDPGTKSLPYTIGYGSTFYEDGTKVKLTDKITQQRADELLLHLVEPFENYVKKEIKVILSDTQISALTVMVYNIGMANFGGSTLLKYINSNKSIKLIKEEWLKWNKSGGKIMKALVLRRANEFKLYSTK